MKKTQAYEFKMSDGRSLALAPDEGADVCYATFDDGELLLHLDVATGDYQLYSKSDRVKDKARLRVVGMKIISVDVSANSAPNSEVGNFRLGCCVSGGCCNCGWGWICNSCGSEP